MSSEDQKQLINAWNKAAIISPGSLSIKFSSYISEDQLCSKDTRSALSNHLEILKKWEAEFDTFINDSSNSSYDLSAVVKELSIIKKRIREINSQLELEPSCTIMGGMRKSGKRKSGKRKSGKRKSGKRKSGKRKSGKRRSGKI